MTSTTPQDQLPRAEPLLPLARRAARYWWIAALVAVVGSAGAAGAVMLRARTYQSRTVLIYRDLIPTDLLVGRDAATSDRDTATRYREMLMSQPMLGGIIEREGLYGDIVAGAGMPAAVEHMREQITFRARGGGTFHILFRATTRDDAQRVTEQLASELIDWERRLQVERNAATSAFLRRQREDAESELSGREAELAEFLSEHPEFADEAVAVTGAAGASVRARERQTHTSAEDPAVLALKRQRLRIRAQLDQRPVTLTPSPMAPSKEERQADDAVAKARRELEDALRLLSTRSAMYTAQHPDVVAAAARAREARERLRRAEDRATAARAKAGARTDPTPVRIDPLSDDKRAELRAELRKIEQAIARRRRSGAAPAAAAADLIVELETEWARLHREVQRARERYDDIETRAFSASIIESSRSGATGGQLAVLDPASRPSKPLGPSTRLLAVAALFVFCSLGVAAAMVAGALDDRITTGADVERMRLGKLLVSVPHRRRAHATRSH